MFQGNFATPPSTIYGPASFDATSGKRARFPANAIPLKHSNTVGQKLLAYYLPGADYRMRPLNVFGRPVQTQNSDQGGLRLDANLGSKHALFGQYMREKSPVEKPALFSTSGLFYDLSAVFVMA